MSQRAHVHMVAPQFVLGLDVQDTDENCINIAVVPVLAPKEPATNCIEALNTYCGEYKDWLGFAKNE